MITGFVEDGLYRAFGFNPCVAMHELRLRMRGHRPFLVLLGYCLVAAAAVVLALAVQIWDRQSWPGPVYADANLGHTTFLVLAYTQLTLIVFVLPAYAAGAIALEREKQTLEMLQITRLSASDVVSGKLIVVVAFGFVLLVTSLPIAAWCLLLGGVEPTDVFYVYTLLLAVSAWVSALGMLISSGARRSIGAVVGTYLTLLLLLAGLPILYAFIISELETYSSSSPTLGIGVACLAVVLAATVLGWLLFVALRRTTSRLCVGRATPLGIALAALGVSAAAVLFAAWWAEPIITTFSGASLYVPLVLHPYVALVGIVDEQMAEEMLTSSSAWSSGAVANPSACIWATAVGVSLLAALVLWVLSIRLLQARNAQGR